MDAHRRAVVAGADLRAPGIGGRGGARLRLARRVALVADCLARVLAHADRARRRRELRERRARRR